MAHFVGTKVVVVAVWLVMGAVVGAHGLGSGEWALGVSTALVRNGHYGRGYHISYGALSANRVPCPPRSGKSYYTHNCFESSEPANPYHRGCSCIAHCRS